MATCSSLGEAVSVQLTDAKTLIGEYNGVVLRQAFDVTNGVSNAGAAQTSVFRAVLLGGQAAMMAFGQKDSPGKYRWNEELIASSVAVKAANDNQVNSKDSLAA
jgi:Protein of unknown function (DUF4043)